MLCRLKISRPPRRQLLWLRFTCFAACPGKTTTLAMLTGRARPSGGDARVRGRSVIGAAAPSRARLGFCPQSDPLFELLSAREHLAMYARLKVRGWGAPAVRE